MPNKGAIKPVEQYTEGYCFTIAVPKKSNPSLRKIWLICMEEENQIKSLRESFIKTKIKMQRLMGDVITVAEEETGEDKDIGPKGNSLDGYWRIAKDWGECTKICGGGKQFRQLVCVKPTVGSKDCVGSAIRERECNTQPCPEPEAMIAEDPNHKDAIDFEKAEIKFVPISNKPRRYDKCIIKESDALAVKPAISQKTAFLTSKFIEPQKIPVRLVMNSKSITAFLDEEYETPFKTLDLATTEFVYKIEAGSTSHSKFCFILKDALDSRLEVCQLGCDEEKVPFSEEWRREIDIFQHHCKDNTDRNEVDADIQLQAEIAALQSELQRKKKEEVQKIEMEKEIRNLEKEADQSKTEVYSYLQKEKKLQELLEKEEEEKGAMEVHDLQIQLEEEKKKQNCLLSSLKSKKLAKKIEIKQAQIDDEKTKLIQQAQIQLGQIREASKNRIEQFKKINGRKLKDIQMQIEQIRSESASMIRQASISGDINKCFIGKKENKSDIEAYCGIAFLDDPGKYIECIEYERFCFTCCENEFSDENERQDCYDRKCVAE
ncbi:MAG: thrombospondin type-1 domain-containing protein [archaeon]|nr:thrombospondin type-1 domain-containing protein [archaeon]